MNIKELLLIVLLALATSWAVDYLFFGKRAASTEDLKSGQSFVVPTTKQELLKPLNAEIDFADIKRTAPAIITSLETPLMKLEFSTDGAALERLEFKRIAGDINASFITIFPMQTTEREKKAFMVALAEKTPYFYSLVDKQEQTDAWKLIYRGENDEATLTKIYTIYKNSYKFDLELVIEPKKEGVQARIFYPAPLMPDIAETDVKSGIISEEHNAITKIGLAKLGADKGWIAPSLFGVENKYFVHAMVDDPMHFTQRAYFKTTSPKDLMAILEGPMVTTQQRWKLSWYLGPKEEPAMALVDPRLQETLDYAGWLAPISRLLLKILIFFFAYVHNYGLAIIILTIIIKLLLLPFSLKGAQGMKQTQEMQRKLQYIQQKYKHDPETLARERAELVRKHGMPGMAGCLPILLQIPVFIALSRVLSSSIELYKAPFGGWITDLSAADPYYILPLLIAATMLLQAATVEQKQRMQLVVMALVFGAVSVSFSAGLCLYIFVSTLLTVIQSLIQNKGVIA